MGKKNVCVAFSTQKGGAGKTTLTVLIASYLYYMKGYSIAVVDCDYPQYSIVRMRERDIRMATDDEHYKALAYEQFTRLDKKMYPVITSVPDKAAETVRALVEMDKYDLIFLDPPYETELLETAIAHIARHDLLNVHGMMIAEHPVDKALPALSAPYRMGRTYRYGKIAVTIYHRDGDEGAQV